MPCGTTGKRKRVMRETSTMANVAARITNKIWQPIMRRKKVEEAAGELVAKETSLSRVAGSYEERTSAIEKALRDNQLYGKYPRVLSTFAKKVFVEGDDGRYFDVEYWMENGEARLGLSKEIERQVKYVTKEDVDDVRRRLILEFINSNRGVRHEIPKLKLPERMHIDPRFAGLASTLAREIIAEGGAGSGNWGHKGRPGLRGGSAPRGSGGGTVSAAKSGSTGVGGKATKGGEWAPATAKSVAGVSAEIKAYKKAGATAKQMSGYGADDKNVNMHVVAYEKARDQALAVSKSAPAGSQRQVAALLYAKTMQDRATNAIENRVVPSEKEGAHKFSEKNLAGFMGPAKSLMGGKTVRITEPGGVQRAYDKVAQYGSNPQLMMRNVNAEIHNAAAAGKSTKDLEAAKAMIQDRIKREGTAGYNDKKDVALGKSLVKTGAENISSQVSPNGSWQIFRDRVVVASGKEKSEAMASARAEAVMHGTVNALNDRRKAGGGVAARKTTGGGLTAAQKNANIAISNAQKYREKIAAGDVATGARLKAQGGAISTKFDAQGNWQILRDGKVVQSGKAADAKAANAKMDAVTRGAYPMSPASRAAAKAALAGKTAPAGAAPANVTAMSAKLLAKGYRNPDTAKAYLERKYPSANPADRKAAIDKAMGTGAKGAAQYVGANGQTNAAYKALAPDAKAKVLTTATGAYRPEYVRKADQGKLNDAQKEINKRLGAAEAVRANALKKAETLGVGTTAGRAAMHMALSMQQKAQQLYQQMIAAAKRQSPTQSARRILTAAELAVKKANQPAGR